MKLFDKIFRKKEQPKHKTYGDLLRATICLEDLRIQEINQSPAEAVTYLNIQTILNHQEGLYQIERKRYIG